MLKTQTGVLILGGIVTIATIALFMVVTDLPYLRLPFVAAVVLFGANFLACMGEFYSESEAKKMGENRTSSPRRYKEDATYARASVVAVVILIIPILALLVTMWLNQCGIAKVPFWVQLLITIGGFFFTRLISVVYESGYTGAISPRERAPQPPLVPPVKERKTVDTAALAIVTATLNERKGLIHKGQYPDLNTPMRSLADEADYCHILEILELWIEKEHPGRSRVLDIPMFVINTPQMRCYDRLRTKYTTLHGDAYWKAIAKGLLDELPTLWDHLLLFTDMIEYNSQDSPLKTV